MILVWKSIATHTRIECNGYFQLYYGKNMECTKRVVLDHHRAIEMFRMHVRSVMISIGKMSFTRFACSFIPFIHKNFNFTIPHVNKTMHATERCDDRINFEMSSAHRGCGFKMCKTIETYVWNLRDRIDAICVIEMWAPADATDRITIHRDTCRHRHARKLVQSSMFREISTGFFAVLTRRDPLQFYS